MVLAHSLGFVFSIQAVMQTRTEQGAIAWAFALNTIPVVAVPAWFVFGSNEVEDYRSTMRVGMKVRYVMDAAEMTNRYQLNFRNHRKIVVVDGKRGFLGGLNVGDEYLGKDSKLTPWRDTHMEWRGPIVKCLQIPFAEDWRWATGELLTQLDWEIRPEDVVGDVEALCLATGPADPFETCAMGFLHQKVMVVDDTLSVIGSANLDNRSFRLNFEVIGIVSDTDFNTEVSRMLEADLAQSKPTGSHALAKQPFWFRLGVRLSRMLAPIQ